jgi:hypothetical protein
MMSKEEIKRKADAAEARRDGADITAKEISEDEINAEVKKLAALPIGVCESSRVEMARRLHMRASVLDILVKAERSKAAKAGNDFLPHWKVEPWAEPVDGAALLDELQQYFNRYAVTPKHTDVVLALWSLHTWVFDSFDITPYLVVTSPTRRCGKSLVLTMLQWLCCRAKKNDSMSKAAIYRSVEAERPTLVLDETSWVVDLKDDRQGILCGGFERNGFVEVCEGESANITVRRYSTYCPKAFGIIGKLTATLMDRSIEIAMQRKTKVDRVERLGRRDNAGYAELRRQCLRFANDNREAVAAVKPKAPSGLNDRALDIWEPLLAIAEHVGGEWPKLACDAAVVLSGEESAAEEISVELLRDIENEFNHTGSVALTTKTLLAGLTSLGCNMTNKPNPAHDTIVALAELFPQCFAVFEQHRQPLKVGIHLDLLAKLNGAITSKECANALRLYCSNGFYLRQCIEGAPRVDLNGEVAGHVTAEEAANAKQRLAQRQAKRERRRLVQAKAKAEAKIRNAGRISLADLRAAAQARRAMAGV